MATITVRVQPRASRSRLEASPEGIKVWLTAPPTDGQANAALCELIAKRLGIAKSKVQVIRGTTSRTKVLEVEGWEIEAILGRLSEQNGS